MSANLTNSRFPKSLALPCFHSANSPSVGQKSPKTKKSSSIARQAFAAPKLFFSSSSKATRKCSTLRAASMLGQTKSIPPSHAIEFCSLPRLHLLAHPRWSLGWRRSEIRNRRSTIDRRSRSAPRGADDGPNESRCLGFRSGNALCFPFTQTGFLLDAQHLHSS